MGEAGCYLRYVSMFFFLSQGVVFNVTVSALVKELASAAKFLILMSDENSFFFPKCLISIFD